LELLQTASLLVMMHLTMVGAMRPLSCLCYVSLWWYLLWPLLLSIEDLTVLYLITVHCSLSYNLAVALAKDALKIDTAD